MKNRVLLVFLAMVLVVSLAAFGACAAPVEEEEKAPLIEEKAPPVKEKAPTVKEEAPAVKEKEAPPVEEVWEWPDKLHVGAGALGTMSHVIAIGWTTPLAKETGSKIRIVTEASAGQRALWLRKGMITTAVLEGANMMLEANEEWATRDGGPFQVRFIWPSARSDMGYAVRGDAGIKTPYDIKPGTKVGYMPAMGPMGRLAIEALLAWAQVDPEDVEWVPASSWSAIAKLLIDGKADLCLATPATPAWYEVEACPRGLAWIELNAEEDPEGAKRLLELHPMPSPFGKMGTLGVPSAAGVWGMVKYAAYTARADADPELIYQLVKWLAENLDKYKDAHLVCATMTVDTLMEIARCDYVPIHDGAIRLLKEKGLWTEADEKRNQESIELIDSYIEAFQTAIDMADDEGIKVDPENEDWLELWESYKKEVGLPKFKIKY